MAGDTLSALVALTLFWGVAVVTPGPNVVLITHAALRGRQDMAAFAALGCIVGTAIWAIAGLLGLFWLLEQVPPVFLALKIVGGLYLIWRGIVLIRHSRRTAQADQTAEAAGASRIDGAVAAFRGGFLTALSNPKTAALVTALFALTGLAGLPLWAGLAGVAIMLGQATLFYAALVGLFSHARVAALYRRAARWIETVAGLVFIAFGLKLATDRG